MAQELEIEREDSVIDIPPELTPKPPIKMSFEEFLASDIESHVEWVDGEVIFMSPATNKHQLLVGFLYSLMSFLAEARDAGMVIVAPFAMKISEKRGREPDILFIAKENLERLKSSHLLGAADIAVEIVSPESRTRDSKIKLREYEQGGIQEYWLLDQPRKQAAFYRLNAEGVYELAPVQDGIFRSLILPGLELKVAWLWQDPLPPLVSVLREWELI